MIGPEARSGLLAEDAGRSRMSKGSLRVTMHSSGRFEGKTPWLPWCVPRGQPPLSPPSGTRDHRWSFLHSWGLRRQAMNWRPVRGWRGRRRQ